MSESKDCCMYSFMLMGLDERFAPHKEGDMHRCEVCDQLWIVVDGVWTKVTTQ